MLFRSSTCSAILLLAILLVANLGNAQQAASGWLTWRGPDQNGTSTETGLATSLAIDAGSKSWRYPLSGRGTPVIA